MNRGAIRRFAAILLSPCHPDADAGFIIMEQTEYPAMSGGSVISVATVLLETSIIPMVEPVTEFVLERIFPPFKRIK